MGGVLTLAVELSWAVVVVGGGGNRRWVMVVGERSDVSR